MFDQMKPGHVLRFGTCPSQIQSPQGGAAALNDNTLETAWPGTNTLGAVRCISHPRGRLGEIAAHVATHMRPGFKPGRSLSYSRVGRAVTASKPERQLGTINSDFVGYTDGKSYYIDTYLTAFSKDFSGCLFVSYTTAAGQRRVAHSAASQVPTMDCKQAFLDTIRGGGARLNGWFRPFMDARDGARRANAFQAITGFVNANPYAITTFGVMTHANRGYAVDAFKPAGLNTNEWVVTHVANHQLSQSWNVG